jgi:uncharacterized membrane protein (UPF0127 family)
VRAAATAAVIVAIAVLCFGCGGPETRSVRLGQEEWTVLVGSSEGMRGRTDLAGADGMLFDLGREVDPRGTVFTMAGVSIPLDIAWFDGTGALVGSASMPLCEAEPCPVYAPDRPYRWAIEAGVGAFDGVDLDLGLEVLD